MFNTKTSVKVTPWLSLKKTIYEIYEMRALRSGELEGSVGGSFITLDEFTCLYFLSVSLDDQQRNGTRRNAEKKMLNFIASLKFYSKLWPRANTYGKLASVIGRAALPGTFKNTSIDEFDIFTQHYFIWTFKVLLTSKDQIKDFNDGSSYLTKADALSFSKTATFYLLAADQTKFDSKVQREIRSVTKPGQKAFDGVDVDVLVALILEEFIECRFRIFKLLKSKYLKLFEVEKGS